MTGIDATGSSAETATVEVPLASRPDLVIPEGRGLREHAASGVLVNAGFNVVLSVLGIGRRFAVAGFLSAEEYGLWGLLIAAMITLLFLKAVGISDKYIQQSESDQELAFQKAYTLEAIVTGVFTVLMVAALPLFALIYNENGIILPGLVLTLTLPGSLLEFPRFIFYRRMQFGRQRALDAIDPVSALIITVALAAAGAGYWSLVIGTVAGTWLAGIATYIASPYKLRFRYDPGTFREYYSFSWPLFISQGSGLIMVQAILISGKGAVGLAGIGAIGLALMVTQLAETIDGIVTRTLYPAVCAIADRRDVLYESFVKSNRLALMWGMPFGIAVSLFAHDLVQFALGPSWSIATPALQGLGICAALSQVAFNWDAYMRATANTKAIATVSVGVLVASLVATVPAMMLWGLKGFAAGQIARIVVMLGMRAYVLAPVFPQFRIHRQALRAFIPIVPGLLLVLAIRASESGTRRPSEAILEGAVFAIATIAATWTAERVLLREAVGYLARAMPRRVRPQQAT